MNYSTDNTRIIDRKKVPAPYELVNKYPINDEISKLVYGTRNEISQILHDKDDRIFVVVGPCSIHDPQSAIEYAERQPSPQEPIPQAQARHIKSSQQKEQHKSSKRSKRTNNSNKDRHAAPQTQNGSKKKHLGTLAEDLTRRWDGDLF